MNQTSNVYRKASSSLLSPEELFLLRTARGGIEWEQIKGRIRAARGGNLPPDWYIVTMGSGMIANKIKEWSATTNAFYYREMFREDFQQELALLTQSDEPCEVLIQTDWEKETP